MARRHFLHRKHKPETARQAAGRPTVARLLALLEQHVIDRFAYMSMTDVQAVALAVSEPDEEDPALNPSHPACIEFSASAYCHESWRLHLAKLKQRPETHWGTCRHGRICAIIPVVCGTRCLAAVKLASPAPLDNRDFARLVELLELLIRDFTVSHGDFLRRVSGGIDAGAAGRTATDCQGALNLQPTHPQVARALEYIAAHLSDPGLTVARVASVLDLYPTYLSEIFARHVGQPMGRFIACRRIALARTLLATTDWQVKRIAIETGHANPNWFCHVFSAHTGLTPGEYRSASRAKDPPVSDTSA